MMETLHAEGNSLAPLLLNPHRTWMVQKPTLIWTVHNDLLGHTK